MIIKSGLRLFELGILITPRRQLLQLMLFRRKKHAPAAARQFLERLVIERFQFRVEGLGKLVERQKLTMPWLGDDTPFYYLYRGLRRGLVGRTVRPGGNNGDPAL